MAATCFYGAGHWAQCLPARSPRVLGAVPGPCKRPRTARTGSPLPSMPLGALCPLPQTWACGSVHVRFVAHEESPSLALGGSQVPDFDWRRAVRTGRGRRKHERSSEVLVSPGNRCERRDPLLGDLCACSGTVASPGPGRRPPHPPRPARGAPEPRECGVASKADWLRVSLSCCN